MCLVHNSFRTLLYVVVICHMYTLSTTCISSEIRSHVLSSFCLCILSVLCHNLYLIGVKKKSFIADSSFQRTATSIYHIKCSNIFFPLLISKYLMLGKAHLECLIKNKLNMQICYLEDFFPFKKWSRCALNSLCSLHWRQTYNPTCLSLPGTPISSLFGSFL